MRDRDANRQTDRQRQTHREKQRGRDTHTHTYSQWVRDKRKERQTTRTDRIRHCLTVSDASKSA